MCRVGCRTLEEPLFKEPNQKKSCVNHEEWAGLQGLEDALLSSIPQPLCSRVQQESPVFPSSACGIIDSIPLNNLKPISLHFGSRKCFWVTLPSVFQMPAREKHWLGWAGVRGKRGRERCNSGPGKDWRAGGNQREQTVPREQSQCRLALMQKLVHLPSSAVSHSFQQVPAFGSA